LSVNIVLSHINQNKGYYKNKTINNRTSNTECYATLTLTRPVNRLLTNALITVVGLKKTVFAVALTSSHTAGILSNMIWPSGTFYTQHTTYTSPYPNPDLDPKPPKYAIYHTYLKTAINENGNTFAKLL
jgi:hypothetical protein